MYKECVTYKSDHLSLLMSLNICAFSSFLINGVPQYTWFVLILFTPFRSLLASNPLNASNILPLKVLKCGQVVCHMSLSIFVLLKLISKKFFRKFEILKSVKSLPLILRTLAFLRIMLFLVLKIINVEWMYVAIHRNLELFKVNISQSTTSHSNT